MGCCMHFLGIMERYTVLWFSAGLTLQRHPLLAPIQCQKWKLRCWHCTGGFNTVGLGTSTAAEINACKHVHNGWGGVAAYSGEVIQPFFNQRAKTNIHTLQLPTKNAGGRMYVLLLSHPYVVCVVMLELGLTQLAFHKWHHFLFHYVPAVLIIKAKVEYYALSCYYRHTCTQ